MRPVFALVILLAAAAPMAAETTPATFTIAYRASPGRVDYHVRQLDRYSDQGEKESPAWKISDIHQAVGQEVKPTPAGKLLVDGQVLGESVWSSEKADGEPAPLAESRPFRYEMSAQGSLTKEPDASDATAVMLPVFPEQPIKPGTKWTLARPVAPGVYVPLEVKHEFLEVQVVDGMPCAIIVSEAQAKEAAPDGRTGCAMKGNARTAVSLTDGQLMYFEAFTSLALKTAPLSSEPPNVFRRETVRSVVRQAPGKLDAP